MNLTEEKIKEKLNSARIQTNGKYISRGWTILGPCLGVAIIIGIVASYLATTILMVVAGVIILVGIIVSWQSFSQARKIDKRNEKLISGLIPSLHQIYYENSSSWLPNLDLKFNGIYPSTIFKNNCFHFNIGSEKIVWDIDEDIEKRTRTYRTAKGRLVTTTYDVYIIKCCLTSSAEKLIGMNEMLISEGKTPKKNESFFHSESIAFNDRFKVQSSDDKMAVYKLFTPKIIDNFIHEADNFLHAKVIKVSDGKVQISWRGKEATKSYIPDPLDFSTIRWTKSKMMSDILNKLTLDFNRYLEIQKMLAPLELYH